MSRSNYDKPFYVDVGTSIVAVRCASDHDVVIEHDHVRWKWAIEEAERVCDRLNKEVDQHQHKMREACRAMRSGAVEMHEACRAMNDDGDPTLCEKLKCPHYGEPNGCNSPTGEYPSVGSAAEMYEALKAIAAICDGDDTGGLPERIAIYNLAKAALSKPPRNCDVGSEEEQSRRYEAFCEAHHMQCDKGCSACPCSKKSGVSCELCWSQMPYVEKEGDNK